MLRLLGLLFICLGATAAALDWSDRGAEGFSFASLGSFWFRLHKDSLIGFQSGIENRVQPGLWESISAALQWPAAPTLGALGMAFLVLGMLLRIRAASKRAKRI
jgi:hypothetical protein